MSNEIRLDKLLSGLGYCSRSAVSKLLRERTVTAIACEDRRLLSKSKVSHSNILFNGEKLDPPHGIVAAFHKPPGYICTRSDSEGATIYDLLPPRWGLRNPPIVSAGRLDKESEGLLILSDDGDMVHRLTSPKKVIGKLYEVWLQDPIRGHEAKLFGSGELVIKGRKEFLKPAFFRAIDLTHVEVVITEGRYHQVRLMFEAVGNKVTRLVRTRIGSFGLDGLPLGHYRILSSVEVESLFVTGCSAWQNNPSVR